MVQKKVFENRKKNKKNIEQKLMRFCVCMYPACWVACSKPIRFANIVIIQRVELAAVHIFVCFFLIAGAT